MRIHFLAVGVIFACAASIASEPDSNWAQWRGPNATGVAPRANPPIEWGESKNVRWKVDLPGRSDAAPIVWDDRVYVLTAVDTNKHAPGAPQAKPADEGQNARRRRFRRPSPTSIYAFKVLALDRKTGEQVWERTVAEVLPHEAGHPDSTQASASPVTDGKHIIAFFGSRGLYCLDMSGKIVWSKDLGTMHTRMQFGEGSSPALHGNVVVIKWDHEGDDFIAAFDKRTGDELWRTPRDESTSWSTPIIVDVDGKPQVIASASKRIRAYDLKSGAQVWECGGMTSNVIPSPVAGDGIAYCISGFRGSAALAIRLSGAKGDITDSDRVAWKYSDNTPYVSSPLLYGDALYFLDRRNSGILTCLDSSSGEVRFKDQRLGVRGVYASPVGAADRVYIAGRDGKTVVLKRGSAYEVLATNTLDDGFDASPAIAGNELFLRGREHLYCIASD